MFVLRALPPGSTTTTTMRSRRQRSPIRAARRALSLKLPIDGRPAAAGPARPRAAAPPGSLVATLYGLGGLVVTTALAASFAWALVAQCVARGLAASATVVFASCCLPEPPKKPADEYFAPPPRDEAAASPTDSVCSCSCSSSLASDDAGDDDDSFVDVGAECACDDAEWTAISS